ncbi:hypothetical protein BCR34DRAFT_585714 [Clohesyomyces aquaticus]|uniref:Uncharacterized protein n=1 Tax=Clohesyomyces aquaticus TaxID=1231657 RepID=A0A1Y1ZW98_9PLEO|nr:hypothetical protein BCR34DRAFT_585714 [Clohesyomyces aquaticus]
MALDFLRLGAKVDEELRRIVVERSREKSLESMSTFLNTTSIDISSGTNCSKSSSHSTCISRRLVSALRQFLLVSNSSRAIEQLLIFRFLPLLKALVSVPYCVILPAIVGVHLKLVAAKQTST